MCIKVEHQLLRKPSCKDSYISYPKSDFHKDFKRDFSKERDTTHKNPTKVIERGETSTKRSSEIKCFKVSRSRSCSNPMCYKKNYCVKGP